MLFGSLNVDVQPCAPLLLQVRLKRFLEMRGADGGPWRMICALPALWVGLIYEPQAQREALELISSWTQDDRDYLRTGVWMDGLHGTLHSSGSQQMGQTGYRMGQTRLEHLRI